MLPKVIFKIAGIRSGPTLHTVIVLGWLSTGAIANSFDLFKNTALRNSKYLFIYAAGDMHTIVVQHY